MDKKLIEKGVKISDSYMCEEDKIWSRYSNDKVDIGEELAKVIRTLDKALPLSSNLRAFSLGSSDEPQFRILETAFQGGLYLLDIEGKALSIVKERIKRQMEKHVTTIQLEYNKIFLSFYNTVNFLNSQLGGEKIDLITLHHSLYYSEASNWGIIFKNLYTKILAPKGAMHAVLMASESNDQYTTTWLYNNFAGKFCASHNDQDLKLFSKWMKSSLVFKKAQIFLKTHKVYFYVDDFEKFMAVVWMVLLYPNVHKFSFGEREEIAEFIYKKFWIKKRPLVQLQDHLIIYKDINFKGLA